MVGMGIPTVIDHRLTLEDFVDKYGDPWAFTGSIDLTKEYVRVDRAAMQDGSFIFYDWNGYVVWDINDKARTLANSHADCARTDQHTHAPVFPPMPADIPGESTL